MMLLPVLWPAFAQQARLLGFIGAGIAALLLTLLLWLSVAVLELRKLWKSRFLCEQR
jgi:hypothetical protein